MSHATRAKLFAFAFYTFVLSIAIVQIFLWQAGCFDHGISSAEVTRREIAFLTSHFVLIFLSATFVAISGLYVSGIWPRKKGLKQETSTEMVK